MRSDCAGKALALADSCDITVTLAPTVAGAVTGTVSILTAAGTMTVPVSATAAVTTATLGAPSTAWSQPSATPLDGLGSWVAVATEPVAGAGQRAPTYLLGHVFGFSASTARGAVSLVADPTGRFAMFNVVGPDGTPHVAAVPFQWTAGRLYFPLVYRLGPGVWGAWIYDHSAGTWVAVGRLELPAAWGKLAPQSTTTAVWYGPAAPTCASYPRADVLFYPPTGYVGTATTQATSTAMGDGGGDCPAQSSVEFGMWARYRLGSG